MIAEGKGVSQGGPLSPILREQGLISIKELWVNIYLPQADSLSGHSPINFEKRPVWTRMLGVVGAEGEKPSASRLELLSLVENNFYMLRK